MRERLHELDAASRRHGLVSLRRRRWRARIHLAAFLPALCGALWWLRADQAASLPNARATPPAELILCLDVSRSMLARDLAPSRLGRAQAEIRALAEAAPADRLSLFAFAGAARLIVPPTLDGALLADLADLCGPASVERGGSDLGAGLEAVAAGLPEELQHPVTVLILTDGEDLEGRGARAAAALAQRGVVVHCVGFGSARGSKIVVPGPSGDHFLRDANGREVVSTLDEAVLRALARSTGGDYFAAQGTAAVLPSLYAEEILPRTRRAALADARHATQGPTWCLSLAAALWILVLAGRDGRKR